MAIGILALGFAGLCGLVSLASFTQKPEPKREEKKIDYSLLNPIEF